MREKRQRNWTTVENWPFLSTGRKKVDEGGERRQENDERVKENVFERMKEQVGEIGKAERDG